jgi:acyl carrier protein
MTRDDIHAAFVATLRRIAPEVDPGTLRGDVPLRDQVDLDSMDLLNLLIGLSETLGIEVPEADYGRLATIDQAVGYLLEHVPAGR